MYPQQQTRDFSFQYWQGTLNYISVLSSPIRYLGYNGICIDHATWCPATARICALTVSSSILTWCVHINSMHLQHSLCLVQHSPGADWQLLDAFEGAGWNMIWVYHQVHSLCPVWHLLGALYTKSMHLPHSLCQSSLFWSSRLGVWEC